MPSLRERFHGRMASILRDTPVRSLVMRGYMLAMLASMSVLALSVGFIIYGYLTVSSTAHLAIHVEAAWYRLLPHLRPQEEGPPPPPPQGEGPGFGPPPDDGAFKHGPPPRHRFGLQAPLDLAVQAPVLVRDIASHPFFRARILSPDGTVLAASRGAERLPSLGATTIQELERIYEQQRLPSSEFTLMQGRRWLVLSLPVYRDGKVVAVLQTAAEWFIQERLLQILVACVVGTALLALVLGLVVSGRLSAAIVRPLERLADITRQLAAGRLEARTNLSHGRNEVMAVASSFDDMAAQLQATFVAQKRFVADASHELKTPLTAISGMVDLLEVGADRDADRRRLILETMALEVTRMNRLVADLLTLSRAEQRTTCTTPLDAAELVQEVADEVRMLDRGHEIHTHLQGPLVILADRESLYRALRNLVDNALKYSGEGTPVALTACALSDGRVEIAVSDQGIGIPPEDLERVFERFYRTDRSRTRGTGGSGLGLAIVRAIIEGRGGTVYLESQSGQGTVARIRLPGAIPIQPGAGAERRRGGADRHSGTPRGDLGQKS